MITYFPTPLPDELLYSICARYADLMRYSGIEEVNIDLFGSRGKSAAVDLPSHLDRLVGMLPRGHYFTTNRFIYEYTLFPFYEPFLPPERAKKLRKAMASTDGNAIHKLAGVTPSNIRTPNWLRYCPICVNDDKREYQACYWHRLHQVPGVEVCPNHGVFLEDSTTRARNKVNHAVYTPTEQAVSTKPPRPTDKSDPHHTILLHIAQDAAWILSHGGLTVNHERLRDMYLSSLSAIGYATRETVHASKLVDAISQFFPKASLEALQCDFDPRKPQCWPAQIVKNLRQGKTHHPLRHLLLIRFLGGTAESFLTELSKPSRKAVKNLVPFGDGPWPCLNPICKHFEKPSIQKVEIANGHSRDNSPKGIFTCSCGFSYARKVSDQVTGNTLRYDRVEAFGSVWEEALKEMWDDSSLSVRQISVRLGISHTSVKYHAIRLGLCVPRKGPGWRVVQDGKGIYERLKRKRIQGAATVEDFERVREGKRNEWLTAVNRHPDATRTSLQREIAPRTYHWLMHRDNEWLKAHMPPPLKRVGTPRRIDWRERDINLAEQVRLAADRIKAAKGRPLQVTTNAIARDLDRKEMLQKKKQLEKLPLTRQALHEVVETQLQFAIRRLGWAADCFREEGKAPALSELALRACVDYRIWQTPDAKAALNERWRELQDSFS